MAAKLITIGRCCRISLGICSEQNILFVRDDVMNTISLTDLNDFIALIKRINPQLTFKILLLSERDIDCDYVIHRIYDPAKLDDYINECYTLDKVVSNTTDID